MPNWRALPASLLILSVGSVVLFRATDGFSAFTTETARRMDVRDHPRGVPDAALETSDGTPLQLGDLRGRWVLIEFIYTRCLTYCAAMGGDLARMQTSLATPIAKQEVALLSISFDPAYDDPPRLAAYKHRFGAAANGLIVARPTDTPGLDSLTRVFGVTAVPDGLGGFVHNAAIAVVNPRGQLVAIMDWSDPAAAVRYVTDRLEP